MEIKIGDKYLVVTDKYNWILKEKRIIDPKHHFSKSDDSAERWVDIGYYTKLEHIVNSLLEKELKESECNSIRELKETILHIKNALKIEVGEIVKVG